MATVHTAYGPGKIVDQETVRGRTQYKVAGDGFEVWLDETKIAALDEDGFGSSVVSGGWEGDPRHDRPAPIFEEEFPDHPMVENYGLGREFDRRRGRDDEDFDESELRYSRRQAWAPLDKGNSTTLPYNPDPQHDARGFSGDDGSSTLQPIHHIDPDERLDDANSITFDDEDGGDEPGPNPDLFAKEGGLDKEGIWHLPLLHVLNKDKDEHGISPAGAYIEGETIGHGLNLAQNRVDQVINALSPGAGWGDLIREGSRHEAILPALLPLLGIGAEGAGAAAAGAAARAAGGAALHGLVSKGAEAAENFGPGESEDGWGDLIKDSSYRPAGLSDKYIDITAGADYHNDPVAQFRHDPDAYINRIGHLYDEGLNPRFAEYMDLVEADGNVRTAAWKDVRKKAMRLKREGNVTVKDIAPNRIMASVVGDHGTYDVLILKSGSFGGLNDGMPGHSISNWHCGCEWGKWAFRRKFTYVGRLCSHAYASYLTMQSAAMKGKPRQQKMERGKKPSRNMYFPTTNMRHADALQNGPERLTPEMMVNDTDDAQMFMDVTKDERTDVGPDDVVSEKDIVHFARLMRHCEVTEQPYPRQLVAFLARYAKEADDTQNDYEAPHTEDAEGALNRIRDFGDRKQEDDFGDMADRVHKIQDAVEEARDNGVDASQFVAAVRKIALPGQDPNVKYDPVQGRDVDIRTNQPVSGGNSNRAILDALNPFSSDYFQTHGTGGALDRTTGNPVDKSKDAESGKTPSATDATSSGNAYRTPEQRAINRTTLDTGTPSSPTGSSDPDAGKNLNNIPSAGGKGGQASGAPAVAPSNGKGSGAGTGTGTGSSSGGSGSGGSGSGGGMTQGLISDGGRPGAENGNNNAITKTSPNVDADGYYTVQKGDTLSDISQRAYGDMNKYQDIAKGNNITNPDVINEGQRIKLDNLNDVGNGGISGDITNPAGSTKAMDGPAAAPKTDAGATPPPAPAPVTTPTSSDAPNNPTPQQPPAPAPLPAEKAAARQRWAAPDAQNPANPANPTQGQNGETNTTAPTTNTAKPGTGTTKSPATPAKPGATTPTSTPEPGGTNSEQQIGPDKQNDTYDPNQGQQPGMGRGNGMPMSNSSGMDALSTGIGAAGDIASGIGNAIPGIAEGVGNAMPGIADAVGGLASGLGSIFASKQDFDEWVRYAYPTADGEGDLEPHTHPFAGSGWPGPLEIGTSEEYADEQRPKMDDVTDLGSGPLAKPLTKWQRQSAVEEDEFDPYREASFEEATDDASDIVRAFQANLDDSALGAGAGGGGRFDDFSGAAQGFLRTAGRNYSLAEQSELIREGDKGGAGNLNSLDLRGTHYEDMNTLGW